MPALRPSRTVPASAPEGDSTLATAVLAVTLDPDLGDMPAADILIDGDKIAAVGPNLEASPRANVIDARSCSSCPQVGSQKLACRPHSDQSQRRRS